MHRCNRWNCCCGICIWSCIIFHHQHCDIQSLVCTLFVYCTMSMRHRWLCLIVVTQHDIATRAGERSRKKRSGAVSGLNLALKIRSTLRLHIVRSLKTVRFFRSVRYKKVKFLFQPHCQRVKFSPRACRDV